MISKQKIRSLLIIALMLSWAISCKKFRAQPEDCTSYDYSNCDTHEPAQSKLSLFFSINRQIQQVPFTLYRGDIEENRVLFSDTAYNGELTYWLDFGTYSVKALYHVDDKDITVIDGGKMEKWSNLVCDSVCWVYDTLNIDLRLH